MMKGLLSLSTSAEQLFSEDTNEDRKIQQGAEGFSMCRREPTDAPGLQIVSELHQVREIGTEMFFSVSYLLDVDNSEMSELGSIN